MAGPRTRRRPAAALAAADPARPADPRLGPPRVPEHPPGTATTEDRQRVLRAVVQDILIGPEKLTIRHRIPVREHAASNGGHQDTTDTEGDMRESSLLRLGA